MAVSALDGRRWNFIALVACCASERLLRCVAGGAQRAATRAVGFEAQIGVQIVDHRGGIILAAVNLRQQQMRHREIRIV